MYLDSKSHGKSIAFMSSHFLVCKIRVFVSTSNAPFDSYIVLIIWFIVFSACHLWHSSQSPLLSPTECPAESPIRSFVFARCVRSSRPVNPDIKLQSDDLSWWDFLITLQWSWPSMEATEMDNPWVPVGGGPRNILDNQSELRWPFHRAIKNISMPWVVCRVMQLNTHFAHKPFPPLLAAAARRSSLLWVISCQALYLNILHPAQFKVQVSP